MKLRLEDNEIRIRLSNPEVEEFNEFGTIEGKTMFGQLPQNTLRYTLNSDLKTLKITASFDKQSITINIPSQLAKEWTNTKLISIGEEIMISDNRYLKVLIEKDFQRLNARHEKDLAAFPNPKANSRN
jgi:hypothetical protein